MFKKHHFCKSKLKTNWVSARRSLVWLLQKQIYLLSLPITLKIWLFPWTYRTFFVLLYVIVLKKNVAVLPLLPPSLIPTAFVVIDAMALVQVMRSASSASFGQMAEQYCTHITRMLSQSSCLRVDLVFDQYRKQSSRKVSDTREQRQVHWKLQSPVLPRQFRNSGGSTSQTLETKTTWLISCVARSLNASPKA